MSVGGPQIPPSQQNIDSSQSVNRPGEDSGRVQKEQYTPKEIGKKIIKLAVQAIKFLSGYHSVRKVDPSTIQATPGLKNASSRPLPATPLSERNIQSIEIPSKLTGNTPLQRSDSISSRDSGFSGDDNLSIDSDIDDIDSDSHYARPEDLNPTTSLIDDDLEVEDHYQSIDSDPPEVSENNNEPVNHSRSNSQTNILSQSGNNSEGGNSSDDSSEQNPALQEPTAEELAARKESVKARKYEAYQEILNNSDLGALNKKLNNSNSYETVKTVAKMALKHSGGDKADPMLRAAQNRMQELDANRLFDRFEGFVLGADYDEIREQAREALEAEFPKERHKSYRKHVMEKLDAILDDHKTRFAGQTPFNRT